ncbi:hypothetical protein B9Z19DRAFT_1075203 [Tuber borchii]|uniref:Uncharacterized protein n=1 Tax=Tuber borchii TaxID=42251 RepID=A0A2T7A3M7_TUBBO|nr:hypothetical protein B9Z19DRAFT_1075203 [Tuber borchii]
MIKMQPLRVFNFLLVFFMMSIARFPRFLVHILALLDFYIPTRVPVLSLLPCVIYCYDSCQ